MQYQECWQEHSRHLPSLVIGDHVRIKNQIGHSPNKWDKTCVIIKISKKGGGGGRLKEGSV